MIVFTGIGGTTENDFYLGDKTDGYKTIYAYNSDANVPGIRWNDDANRWELSNDGISWNEMGGGVSLPVTETDGGTGQTSYTTGDILYASASNTLSKLAIGDDGYVLTVSSGIPSWMLPSGSVVNYETVAECKAAGEPDTGSLCYIQETKSFYQYIASQISDSDDYAFIQPSGATLYYRWAAMGGRLGNAVSYNTSGAISETYSTVALGYNVLNEGTDGIYDKYYATNSVFIGRDVGAALTNVGLQGDRCVVIGDQAYSATSGFEDVVAIGYLVGSAASSTYRNVFIGSYAAEECTGNDSVILGYQAGRNSGDADQAIYIGSSAGRYNTGDYNTFIGHLAGEGASGSSTGQYNTAVGYSAGTDITTGGYNVFMGTYAGRYVTTSTHNVAIGYNALDDVASATGLNYTVIIGASAGDGVTADYTIGIGYDSMNGVTGARNTGIGYQAGNAIGAGQDNVLVGYQAGSLACTNYNTCVGYQAGEYTGSGNCFFGYNAGYQAGSANNTVIIGANAGRDADGDGQVFIGYHAGYQITVGGARNLAIGYEALNDATTSSDNLAVGYQALRDVNTTGTSYTIGIGQNAGQFADGIGSIYIGYQAGYQADVDGNYNVAIGYQAFKSTTSFATAEYNIALGYQSLLATTEGDNNVAIGNTAGDAITTGSNNTLIGQNVDVGTATNSDTVVIGKNYASPFTNATTLTYPDLHIGDATDNDIFIYANTDNANDGYIMYDNTANKWVGSDDGTAIYDLNSGGGGGGGSVTKFDTVANCRAADAPSTGDICYIEETATYYEYVTTGGVADDSELWIANTAAGGNNRWVARAGRYGHAGIYRPNTSAVGRYTVVIGKDALQTGDPNTLGWSSTDSVYIGQNAGNGTGGDYNVVLGAYALDASTGNHSTVAIGFEAGSAMTSTANNNIYIGTQCAGLRTQGSYTTAIGSLAMANAGAGDFCVAIGYQAARYLTMSQSVFIGSYAGSSASGAGVTFSTGVGYGALQDVTTGDFNTCIGALAGQNFTTSLYNTAVGYNASGGASMTASILYTTSLGHNAGQNSYGRYSISIGAESMADASGWGNIGIGYRAGNGINANQYSVAIGYDCGVTEMGEDCVAIGRSCMSNTVAGADDNVAVGAYAGNATGANCVSIGYQSAYQSNSTTVSCTAVGYQAGYLTRGTGAVNIGYQAGYRNNNTGDYNIGIGYQAHYGGASFNTATNNIAIGYRALYVNDTGDNNIMIGYQAGDSLRGANGLIGIGYQALQAVQDATEVEACTAIGYQSMYSGNSSLTNSFYRYNTAVGYQTLYSLTNTGSEQANDNNSAFGYQAMQNATGGTGGTKQNTAIGSLTLQASATFDDCTAVGYNALNDNTGSYNTAVGSLAADALTTGQYNTAVGYQAMSTGVTTGSYNVAVSYLALDSVTSGYENVAIGYQAGDAITTGYHNIMIGSNADAVENDVYDCIVIGADGYIAAQGLGTAHNRIQLGAGGNTANDTMQVGEQTNNEIDCYSKSWQAYSDFRIKKDIRDLTSNEGIEFIKSLRPVNFKHKVARNEFQSREQFGLIAQEVKDVFEDLGLNANGMYTDNDASGWSLNYNGFVAPLIKAVQEQQAQIEELKNIVNTLVKAKNRR